MKRHSLFLFIIFISTSLLGMDDQTLAGRHRQSMQRTFFDYLSAQFPQGSFEGREFKMVNDRIRVIFTIRPANSSSFIRIPLVFDTQTRQVAEEGVHELIGR